MNFSELMTEWELGWRGIAIDGDGNEWDFTKDYICDLQVDVNEEWLQKVEDVKENEVKDIIINLTVNVSGDVDIKNLTQELNQAMAKMRINLI